MLTQAQIEEYNRVGAIVVPDVLSADEVQRLRAVTDEFVEKSRAVTTHNEIYDLEDSHTAASPASGASRRRTLHHPAYGRLVRHPAIVAVLRDLWGQDIRFDTAKLNMKSAGFGAAVEWHQDWAFYPHTNDDLAAVGVMMDDMAMENGPLMIIPGSHKGPVFDHHADGRFCGAMDPIELRCRFREGYSADRPGRVDHRPPRASRARLRAQYVRPGPAPAAVPVPRRRCMAAAWFPRHRGIRRTDGVGPRDAGAPAGAGARPPAAAAGRQSRARSTRTRKDEQRCFENAAAKPELQPVKYGGYTKLDNTGT